MSNGYILNISKYTHLQLETGQAPARLATATSIITSTYMSTQNTKSAWDNVESVETDMIKFETVGKVVVGVLLSRKMVDTKFGESPVYKIMTPEGEAAFFASGLLDDKLSSQEGKIVRIEFAETKPSNKGNDAKIFDVKALPDTEENRVMVGLDASW